MKNKKLDFTIHSLLVILPFFDLAFFLRGFYNLKWTAAIYIINLILLVPVFISDLRNKKFLGFWVFSLTFFYSLPWIAAGFDMTDGPYNLTISWFYPKINALAVSKAPFSYLLAHLWLKLLPASYYLWARIVVNFTLAFILYLAYKIIRTFKNSLTKNWLATVIVFFAFGLLSYNQMKFLAPYDKIAMLLTVVFTYFWFVGNGKQSRIMIFLSGIFLVLAMYSRITVFFILPLMPLLSIIHGRGRTANLIFVLLGIVVGLIILWLANIDLINYLPININTLKTTALTSPCVTLDPSHRPGKLISTYYNDIIRTASFLVVYFTGLYILGWTKVKLKKSVLGVLLILSVVASYFILFRYLPQPVKYDVWFNSTAGVYGALILIVIMLMPEFFIKEWDFVAALILVAIIAFAGSNVGLRKIHLNFATAFVVPIILAIGFDKISRPALYISLLFLALVGFLLNVIFIYRDYPVPKLNSYFHKGIARGVWTRESKIYEVETFNKEISKYLTDRNFISTNKTFYFGLAQDKKPYVICWVISPNGLRQAIEKQNFRYIIFANTSMRVARWDKKALFAADYDVERIKKLKQVLDNNCKIIARSPNNIFVLYKVGRE